MNDNLFIIYGVTIAALVVLRLIMALITKGRFSFKGLITGKDNGLSTSQLQATIWTFIVLASYIAVYTAYFLFGQRSPSISIPYNLLILAGLSYATYIGAGTITQGQLERSYEGKTGVRPAPGSDLKKETRHRGSGTDLINDEENQTDLGKFQLIAWTLIAAVIFLIGMHNNLETFLATQNAATTFIFPDIDTTLLALVGIGQGAYLGKKAFGKPAEAASPDNSASMVAETTTRVGDTTMTEKKVVAITDSALQPDLKAEEAAGADSAIGRVAGATIVTGAVVTETDAGAVDEVASDVAGVDQDKSVVSDETVGNGK